MGTWQALLANKLLCSSLLAWFYAQLLKLLIEAWRSKKLELRLLWSSGGMPSSHSATVCALATASARIYGLSSFEFAMSAVFALVVMYDASGVRLETGKQAKLLNLILESDLSEWPSLADFDETLKELVGHTPLQVMAGAILGFLVAFFS